MSNEEQVQLIKKGDWYHVAEPNTTHAHECLNHTPTLKLLHTTTNIAKECNMSYQLNACVFCIK